MNLKQTLRWLFNQLPLFTATAAIAVVAAQSWEIAAVLTVLVGTMYLLGRRHASDKFASKLRRLDRVERMMEIEPEFDRLNVPEPERERLREVWLTDAEPAVFPTCKSCGMQFDLEFKVKKLKYQAEKNECAPCVTARKGREA